MAPGVTFQGTHSCFGVDVELEEPGMWVSKGVVNAGSPSRLLSGLAAQGTSQQRGNGSEYYGEEDTIL